MSWGSWVHRALFVGAGVAVSSTALLIGPLAANAAPTNPAPTPTVTAPISIGPGGIGLHLGGLDITVGAPAPTPASSGSPTGTDTGLGGVVSTVVGTVNGLLGGSKQPAAEPAGTATTAPTSRTSSPDPQPSGQPTSPANATPTAPQPRTAAAPAGTRPSRTSRAVAAPVNAVQPPSQVVPSTKKDVVRIVPAAHAEHRNRTVAQQLLHTALHPGGAILALAAITAIIAIAIAAMVVSFGRRPGVSITGQMVE